MSKESKETLDGNGCSLSHSGDILGSGNCTRVFILQIVGRGHPLSGVCRPQKLDIDRSSQIYLISLGYSMSQDIPQGPIDCSQNFKVLHQYLQLSPTFMNSNMMYDVVCDYRI